MAIADEDITALQAEVAKLKDDLATLSSDVATDRTYCRENIQRIFCVTDKCNATFADEITQLWERVKMIEPVVYPKLARIIMQINKIIRPREKPGPNEPPNS